MNKTQKTNKEGLVSDCCHSTYKAICGKEGTCFARCDECQNPCDGFVLPKKNYWKRIKDVLYSRKEVNAFGFCACIYFGMYIGDGELSSLIVSVIFMLLSMLPYSK